MFLHVCGNPLRPEFDVVLPLPDWNKGTVASPLMRLRTSGMRRNGDPQRCIEGAATFAKRLFTVYKVAYPVFSAFIAFWQPIWGDILFAGGNPHDRIAFCPFFVSNSTGDPALGDPHLGCILPTYRFVNC